MQATNTFYHVHSYLGDKKGACQTSHNFGAQSWSPRMVSYLAPKLRNRKDAQEQIIRPTESLSKPARAHSGTFLEPYPDPPY